MAEKLYLDLRQRFAGNGLGLADLLPCACIAAVVQFARQFQLQRDQRQGVAEQVMQVAVAAIDGDEATIDANQPLAGKTLIFDITPPSTREPIACRSRAIAGSTRSSSARSPRSATS